MRRRRLLLLLSAVVSVPLWVYACGDGTTEPSSPVPDPQQPTTVAVTPATATVAEGGTLQLTAMATNAHGQLVNRVEFVWASADTAVALVDATGLVTAVGAGQADVTATAVGLTGRAQLTVVPPVPTTVAIIPDTAALTAVGQTAQLTAEVRDQGERVMDGVPVAWSSADTTVAMVDSSGLVTAVGNGAVAVTATAGEASGDAVVTVAINPDRAALVALYHATDGPNWIDNEKWLTYVPLGEWYGVRTDASGRVVDLNLGRNGLTGEIPTELGSLSKLTRLFLGFNRLTGEIPPELGSLSGLESLNLSGNWLRGEIPPELGSLSNLEVLALAYSGLTGEIPPELGSLSNLESLGLNQSSLTGRIPPELGSLSNLEWLSLHRNRLTGEIPPELGSLSNLEVLALDENSLTGEIPAALGDLAHLRALTLSHNELSGPLPGSLIRLERLELLVWHTETARASSRNEGLCVPGTSAFRTWLEGIDSRGVVPESFCNFADRAALEALYEAAYGAGWTESGGWLGGPVLSEWHGVAADSLGRATSLDLTGNGLRGRLPANLAGFTEMTTLRIGDNALSGRLPLSMARIPLREFSYAGTELCEPSDVSLRTWLGSIAVRDGTDVACAPLSDRDILAALYHATDGPNWENSANWVTHAPLGRWHGVETDASGRVVVLNLFRNGLTGEIPPELGSLSNLSRLSLSGNGLTGEIPPELGSLSNLSSLALAWNNLTGEIPPELGSLSNLSWLALDENGLTGEIPPELGSLSNLSGLALDENGLTGEIPPELGSLSNLSNLALDENGLTGEIPPELGSLSNLSSLALAWNNLTGEIPPQLGGLSDLERLHLNQNGLMGPLPPELGRLSRLEELLLTNNSALAGALPPSLTGLRGLDVLQAGGTGLCAPTDDAFRSWLAGIGEPWIALCAAPVAYLTQAVQSREHPVPLVAGERALLRVFPTARRATAEAIPPVRARFYLDGRETHVVEIPGGTAPVPTEIDEGDLAKSANAEIPGRVVRPGLEVVVEVDPDGTLDPELGVAGRIPTEGRMEVKVADMPVLDLTVVPFVWTETQDSSIVGLTAAMEADPAGHELLADVNTLLPVGGLEVTAHKPVLSGSDNAGEVARLTSAIRVIEGGTGYWMGMMAGMVGGLGGGKVSVAEAVPSTIAHELGHNMSLSHAPCGVLRHYDPSFPYPDGSIGAWGYDFDAEVLINPGSWDLMSYCDPSWISGYHFSRALGFRLRDEGAVPAAAAAARSLLLWGGTDSVGVPFLEPAFVVYAPPTLPDSAGDWRLTGHAAEGGELFSLSFAMPEVADAEGRSSSFVFALPARPGWEDLASVTLAGPDAETTLDDGTDRPMTILQDPRSGSVRGFLRHSPPAGQVAADATARSVGPELEVLFSKGLPDATAWRR